MSGDIERAGSQFFGGRVCLDFANTVDWRTSPQPVELIPDYRALLGWSLRRGTMSRQAIVSLTQRDGHTRACVAVMAKAFALRSEIWTICEALEAGAQLKLRRLKAMLVMAPRQPPVIRSRGAFVHAFEGRDVVEPLWPVLWSLSAMLTSVDAQRIGVCHARGCGWFFVDESPNHSRLWCSSAICGNRERVRRSYAKRKDPVLVDTKSRRSNTLTGRRG